MLTQEQRENAAWVPACGGTERPFQMKGKTYLYMWNVSTCEHAHYCVTDDVFLSTSEWLSLLN